MGSFFEFFADGAGDFLLGFGGVDHTDAVGVGLGGGEVAVADGFVKGEGFLFHAVPFVVGFDAVAKAGQALGAVHVEQEGNVRPAGAGRETVNALHGGRGDFAGHALIDGGGIEEAVGDDDLTGGEGGEDFFANELGAAGGKEQELSLGGHGPIVGRMLKKVADVFADGSAAGFADEQGFVAGGAEGFDEMADLCAFAATFRTFESDEETCLTRLGHTGNP